MSESIPPFLKPFHDERIRAVIASDTKSLQDIYSDEFLSIHGRGSADNKKSLIEKRLRPKYIKVLETRYYDIESLVLGDVVIIRGNMDLREEFPDGFQRLPGDNRPTTTGVFSYKVRVTDVWRKEPDGKWRLLHNHECERTSPFALMGSGLPKR